MCAGLASLRNVRQQYTYSALHGSTVGVGAMILRYKPGTPTEAPEQQKDTRLGAIPTNTEKQSGWYWLYPMAGPRILRSHIL